MYTFSMYTQTNCLYIYIYIGCMGHTNELELYNIFPYLYIIFSPLKLIVMLEWKRQRKGAE